jgi:hypothetical protein
MLHRWRRIDEQDRGSLWRLYGWFTGLMLCGSCFGIASWAMYIQWISYVSTANSSIVLGRTDIISRSERTNFFALFACWRAAFSVTYAMEFMCLSVAKLMVLDRMADFLSPQPSARRWVAGRRFVMAAVVAGNVVGLAGNVTAAVQFQPVVAYWIAASADLAANNTASADQNQNRGRVWYESALKTLSVQAFCEVAVLLLIVAAFAVVGAACARRISSAWFAGGVARDVEQLRLQIVGTTCVVFVTFLIRSVYSTMYALAAALQDFAGGPSRCPTNSGNWCDPLCYNIWSHIEVWILRTPEYVLMVVIITKPLPLLVALWGMTSKRLRWHMRARQAQTLLGTATPTRRESCLQQHPR